MDFKIKPVKMKVLYINKQKLSCSTTFSGTGKIGCLFALLSFMKQGAQKNVFDDGVFKGIDVNDENIENKLLKKIQTEAKNNKIDILQIENVLENDNVVFSGVRRNEEMKSPYDRWKVKEGD